MISKLLFILFALIFTQEHWPLWPFSLQSSSRSCKMFTYSYFSLRARESYLTCTKHSNFYQFWDHQMKSIHCENHKSSGQRSMGGWEWVITWECVEYVSIAIWNLELNNIGFYGTKGKMGKLTVFILNYGPRNKGLLLS